MSTNESLKSAKHIFEAARAEAAGIYQAALAAAHGDEERAAALRAYEDTIHTAERDFHKVFKPVRHAYIKDLREGKRKA